MSIIYLVLSCVGFVLSLFFCYQYIYLFGLDIGYFFQLLFENPATALVSSGMFISVLTSFLYIGIDGNKNEIKFFWFAFWGVAIIGTPFGLPLYLFLKERQKNKESK